MKSLTVASVVIVFENGNMSKVNIKYIKTDPQRDEKIKRYALNFVKSVSPKIKEIITKGGMANG